MGLQHSTHNDGELGVLPFTSMNLSVRLVIRPLETDGSIDCRPPGGSASDRGTSLNRGRIARSSSGPVQTFPRRSRNASLLCPEDSAHRRACLPPYSV